MDSFSYVGFLSSSFRVLSVLRLYVYWGFPPSRPSSFHLSYWRLVFRHGSSPSRSPSSTASACHRRLLLSLSLSLSWPSPSSCGVTVLCTVRSLGFGVVSTCLQDLLLLGVSCSFFAWVPGCFVTRAPLCLSAVLLSSWGSRLLLSRLPPSSSFILEFLSRLRGYDLRFPFCNSFSFDLHQSVSASAFPGYCLLRSSSILFLSLCM